MQTLRTNKQRSESRKNSEQASTANSPPTFFFLNVLLFIFKNATDRLERKLDPKFYIWISCLRTKGIRSRMIGYQIWWANSLCEFVKMKCADIHKKFAVEGEGSAWNLLILLDQKPTMSKFPPFAETFFQLWMICPLDSLIPPLFTFCFTQIIFSNQYLISSPSYMDRCQCQIWIQFLTTVWAGSKQYGENLNAQTVA